MNSNLLKTLLGLTSTIPIGSLALEVATETSDLDLCVLKTDLPQDFLDNLEISPVLQYKYEESLLMRYSSLYTLPNLDVFVFTDPNKLAIVRKVMYIMENYPKFVLRIKWVRVKIFRHLLEKEGFLDETPMGPFTNSSTKDV